MKEKEITLSRGEWETLNLCIGFMLNGLQLDVPMGFSLPDENKRFFSVNDDEKFIKILIGSKLFFSI